MAFGLALHMCNEQVLLRTATFYFFIYILHGIDPRSALNMCNEHLLVLRTVLFLYMPAAAIVGSRASCIIFILGRLPT